MWRTIFSEPCASGGASFFADLVRSTSHLPSEVENGLWELVAAGLVTADGFDNMRALMDPHRRRAEGRERARRPRHAAGRWSLLRTAISHQPSAPTSVRSRRTGRAPVVASIRRGVPRLVGAGSAGIVLARAAGAVPPDGTARRDPWWAICERLYRESNLRCRKRSNRYGR